MRSFPRLCARGCFAVAPLMCAAEPTADWNWHAQATTLAQYHGGIHADYSGANSLDPRPETRETTSFDLSAGRRLWTGAEAHVDGLVWQGFGFSDALGAEAFPNGEAFKLGTRRPDAILARAFVRQEIDLGGESQPVSDDALTLPGRHLAERVTITAGKMSVKDVFDNNAYANDPRTQFMNWALMANEAWDYPADSLGYTSGLAIEWTRAAGAVRGGLFAVPRSSNGMPADTHVRRAHGAVVELEQHVAAGGHPAIVRWLAFQNRARMGSYAAALAAPARPADIVATRAYRGKAGVGLNVEVALSESVGVFSRLGWSDGRNEAWCFSDVDRSVSSGVAVQGRAWQRPADTVAVAVAVNGFSGVHRRFLAAGGTGILAGDGALDAAPERAVETYYDAALGRHVRAALDVQYLTAPAGNRARGPVPVVGARLHWEY